MERMPTIECLMEQLDTVAPCAMMDWLISQFLMSAGGSWRWLV
jgi:hypothetical protein